MSTGWERENRTHFDDIVADYDKVRPAYPPALLADIFADAHACGGKKALEIGAGTGKATQAFLAAGYAVTAVEISANMVALLRERFGATRHFAAVHDSFENAALESDAYDVIYAASAFHWVDASIGCPKALQLLRNGGVLALLRYNAAPADGEALYEDIQAVYEKHFRKPYTRPAAVAKADYESPGEIFRGFRCRPLQEYGFVDVHMRCYDAVRAFPAEDYISLMDTMADHRALPDSDRAALYTGIRDAINRHGGQIHVNYIFQLYMGRKSG